MHAYDTLFLIQLNFYDSIFVSLYDSILLSLSNLIILPLHPLEPLKRDDPLSLRKLVGEGELAEHNTYLGWYINTHSLRVFLPEEKQKAWTTDIK